MEIISDIDDRFHQSEVLKDLSKTDYENILSLGTWKNIGNGEVLFHQGDPADRIYLVHSGRLKLTNFREDGREIILRYIGPGELTAVAAVLRSREYPVTAEALCATVATCWNTPTFLDIMREYPQVAVNLLRLLSTRLEEIQQRFFEISTEETERRIARTLLRFMRNAGNKEQEGIRIDFPITREDLAAFTGVTHYTVSRILSAWVRKGWIITARQHITIMDAHSLVMLTES